MAQPFADPTITDPNDDLIDPENQPNPLIEMMNLIPDGDEYNDLRATIERIAEMFPGELPEITPERVQGWVDEIAGGAGRDADGIRDDIFRYIVGPEVIMEVLGVDEDTANQLILGGNDGGINFGDLTQNDDGTFQPQGPPPTGGDPSVDEEDNPLTILEGQDMKWFRDRSTGLWYVQYGVPNSDFKLVFEATQDEMDKLFGEGRRPTSTDTSFESLIGQENVFFGQSIIDMAGEGTFEDEYRRQMTIGLEQGRLPHWAEDSDDILALVFVAESESKSDQWLLDEIAKTDSFAARFPGFQEFISKNNLSSSEGVTGYLEYEAGVRSAMTQIGYDPDSVTPDMIGGLLTKGYAVETVSQSVGRWKRMQDFAPALQAFNSVLVGAGYEPIESLQDQFDFISGVAPAEIYGLWEASSVAEAAEAAGLGDAFTAEDALRFAARTEGHTTLEQATSAFQDAAKMLLRLRHEVDVGKFGLDQDDVINLSLGIPPASGTSAAELTENINRAILSAQGGLRARIKPFTGFKADGTPQAQSLGSLRQS